MNRFLTVVTIGLAAVLAQDFGEFVLESLLTTYSNTLLDATNFILPTDEPSMPERSVPASSTQSAINGATTAPTSRISVAPSSGTSISAQFSTCFSSTLMEVGPFTSTSAPVLVPTSTIVSTPATTVSSSSPESPKETSASTITSETVPTITSYQLPVSPLGHACSGQSTVVWTTSIVTETVSSTAISTLRLYKTTHHYVNWTSETKSASTTADSSGDVVTHTTTSCFLPFSSASHSLFSVLSHSSSLPALCSSTPPFSLSQSPSALPSPSVTAAPSTACGGEVVTTTVYQNLSLPQHFTMYINGTNVLVLDFSHTTCAKPVWPFYEHPQWNSLEANTHVPGPVPKRQQIPSQQVTDSFETEAARRHALWETASPAQNKVVVTTVLSSKITSYPVTGPVVPNFSSKATSYVSDPEVCADPVISPAVLSLDSAILSFQAHQPITSSVVDTTSSLVSMNLSSIIDRDIWSWLESIFLGSPASTTAPTSTVQVITTAAIPVTTTTVTATVTPAAIPAAVTTTVSVSPTQITSGDGATAVSATTKGHSRAVTHTQSSSLLLSFPAVVSGSPQTWTATASSQDAVQGPSEDPPLTVTPSFSLRVNGTEAATQVVSSATSSLASYECVPWTSGNDVLLCHINGQFMARPPSHLLVLLISLTTVAIPLVI